MKYFIFLICFISVLHADMKIEDSKRPSVEELKKQVADVLPTLYGWCSAEKANSFIDLVLEEKPMICVEIGVFGGSSLFPVAAALKHLGEGVIIAIEPWDKKEMLKSLDPVEDAAHLKWWSSVNFERIYFSYLHLLKRFELDEYCITMKMTSEKAVSKIMGPIDIIYIDGNHSEAGSTQDVMLYLPKVREGGYIWLNDILWPSRQQAAEILLETCDIVKIIDNGNCVLFKKR